MISEPINVEAKLRELHPAALDEELLARLMASTDGSLTQLDPEELRFEAQLRGALPARLSPAFLASLENIVQEVAFPVDEKIVRFPKAPAAPLARRRPVWAAAAAVALIGGLSALLVPAGKAPAQLAGQSAPLAPVISPALASNFVPATFNRGLSEVHDEGIIWKSNNQPHSLVRVVYKDQVTLTDPSGRSVLVEQPRVEYMLVPAKTD